MSTVTGGSRFSYPFITIGTQTWSTKNLDVSTYRNGDPIPEVTDFDEWLNLSTGAWCYFDNDPANGEIYGKLYNWYAVADPRGLAPSGWHIPTLTEWNTLSTYLGGDAIAGGKMKEVGDSHWNLDVGATNSSGFTALPGGNIIYSGFYSLGENCVLWSSTADSTINAAARILFSTSTLLDRYSYFKLSGLSVRLIKD